MNIYKHLGAVYGSCAVNLSTIGCWALRVKASESGELELYDLSCSEHTATATSPDMLNCAVILIEKGITSQQLSLQPPVSKESAIEVIKILGFSQICTRLFP